MVSPIIMNIVWTVIFIFIGAFIGTIIIALAASLLPRIIDKWTPHIDYEKEMIRGNTAIAEYFGRIASATIIGISIVIAASVLGGIISGLHG